MKDRSLLIKQSRLEDIDLSGKYQIMNSVLRMLEGIRGVHCWLPVHGKIDGSVPDIISCVDGKFAAFVIISAGSQPNYIQRRMMRDVTEAGGQVFIIHAAKDAITAIHEMRDEFWMYNEDESRCWEDYDD